MDTATALTVIFIALAAIFITLSAIHYLLIRDILALKDRLAERESVPYWLRADFDDINASHADLLTALQTMRVFQENIDAFLDRAELKIGRASSMVGQIRRGEHQKDRPASPGNGK